MSTLSLIVVETESGAEVRVRDSEEPGEAYASLREALDSLLTDPEFKPKAGILKGEDDKPVGLWRWIDATAEEPAPADDGSQVTRDLIAKLASRINAGSPAAMDGVSSTAHSQLDDTSTPSDGFVHVGAEVRDLAGRWHLFAYCELAPEVARATDSGRLAYGSIGFTNDGRLLQHALTNVPAVEGLRPNNSIRGARGVRVHFRTTRITMPKATNVSQRGPALDLLAKIAASLGVSVEDEMSAESFSSPVMDAISAIKSAAKTETALEAAAGAQAPAAPPAEGASAAARDAAPPVAPPPAGEAPRAEGAFPDAAAMEMFASETLALFRDIFGKPDEAPAAVLDLAKASSAAFKGAIGQAAPPADAGAMSASGDTVAKSASGDAHQRTLDEVAKLRTDIARRDLRDAIAKRAIDAKVALPELDQLVTDALAVTDVSARDRMISSAVKAAQTVPSGDVFGRSAPGGAVDLTDFRAAWRSLLPEIEKANQGLPRQHHVAIAQRTARERFPQFADA